MSRLLTYTLILSLCIFHLPAFSEDNVGLVIKKISNAYGGEELKSLTSIKIEDYSKNLWPGQNEVPDLPDFWTINEALTIDYKNRKKSLVSWRAVRTITDFEKIIVSEKSGRVYDLVYKKHTDDDWYNFANTGRSIERASDTLIAKQLLENKDSIKLNGKVQYRGTQHFRISFSLFNQNEHQIFIQESTGLITKMIRRHPRAGELVYVFSNHAKKRNLSFARDMNYFVGGKPRKISTYRNMEVNPDTTFAFEKPLNSSSWGDTIVPDKKVPLKIADSVFLVGTGRSQTIFIDAGEYLISSGGGRNLIKNYQSFLDGSDTNKPLKYVVLPHHHSEHLALVNGALDLNATIITTARNLPVIRKASGQDVAKDRFLLVDKELSVIQDKVQVLNIATAHALQNLVIYLPQSKTLYSQDHFGTIYSNGQARPFKDMKTFINKVSEMGLDIETYVDGRSSRQLSSKEVEKIINNYIKPECLEKYKVCRNS